jgi:catechol 2,3-dioxygenase-like lactoylglutathione lyase family enzyme
MAIKGLHHIHLVVGDLPGGIAFAKDFGLIEASADSTRSYLRGVGKAAYSVLLEKGSESQFAGLAFEVDDEADLEAAVVRHGASSPVALTGPGGGKSVSLCDPNGFNILLVHGIENRQADPLPTPMVLNQGYEKVRVGTVQSKPPLGPPPLMRLGHVGIYIQDWAVSDAWYREVLGMIPSDLMYAGSEDHKVGGFYRLNRGEEHVDHHTVGMFGLPGKQGLHHLSFEVTNPETQFMAHRWLAQRGREEIWGVGRHPLGSHVFDVWRDPNGFRYETFSDTDLLDASVPTGLHSIANMEMDIWSDRNVEIYFA